MIDLVMVLSIASRQLASMQRKYGDMMPPEMRENIQSAVDHLNLAYAAAVDTAIITRTAATVSEYVAVEESNPVLVSLR